MYVNVKVEDGIDIVVVSVRVGLFSVAHSPAEAVAGKRNM